MAPPTRPARHALRAARPPTAASEAAPAGEAPDTIRIGYQLIPNGDAIVRQLGWLEEALPDTKIEWLPFESGGDVNTAVAAGSLDIGLAGIEPGHPRARPPLSLPYAVPWIFDVIGTNEALVATKDSGVTDHRRPRGQEGRHAVRLDRALQPAGRARGRRRRRLRRSRSSTCSRRTS